MTAGAALRERLFRIESVEQAEAILAEYLEREAVGAAA
jgi:hypothetical protein